MADPTCADLKAAYLQLLANGGEVLIKAGDQLVKYTDIDKLRNAIETICGPIVPDGSTAQRSMVFRDTKFKRGGCGC